MGNPERCASSRYAASYAVSRYCSANLRVLVAFVNQVLDFEPRKPDPFARFPDMSHCFGGTLFPIRGVQLFFRQSLKRSFQDLFR